MALFLLIVIVSIAFICSIIVNKYNIPDIFCFINIFDSEGKMEFELGKLLFSGQIALTSVFITFFGLLIQFFQDKKKYLSINVKRLFFSDSPTGFITSSLTFVSFLLIIFSYWFLANNMIASMVFIFVVNLLFLLHLLLTYFRITSGKTDISILAYTVIQKDILEAIQSENLEIKRIRNGK